MYLIAPILIIIGVVIYEFTFSSDDRRWVWPIVAALAVILLAVMIVGIDYSIQTTDEEVWSGRITDVQHKEEWKKWHEGYRDSDGDWHDGYWERHDAENWIETSDGGRIDVYESPTGRDFDNSWPNKTQELLAFWNIGEATASVHTYKNYVQCSYSIYKHEDINLKDYPGLPKYPKATRDYVYIDRFLGNVPNKPIVLAKLAEWNAELNKFIPDPEKPGKMRSWKQVNMIFVNLGDVPEDYGFALQDHWENGNKNDFIVSFATDDKYNVKWVYPFGWGDTQNDELLKLKVREYMMSKGNVSDFVPVVGGVSTLVSELFERKQMAEFSYLKVETSTAGMIVLWVLMILSGVCYAVGRRYVY